MSKQNFSPVIFLMGPTAAGKTALALALHAEFPVDIVSVDSSQVYRGMDVATAKPTLAEQAKAPHRLIDIRDPAEPYSAAEFRVDALQEICKIIHAGRIPLLVGGTMFYFHALEYGLAPLPRANQEVRKRLNDESRQTGWAHLHARLQALDPDAAARIDPNDGQRIQRALEVVELTGRPSSHWHTKTRHAVIPYDLIKIGIYPRERQQLHDRIARRFDRMLEQGLVAEVERLRERGDLTPELPAMRTVGYRQVWQYLTGLVNYNEMIQRGVAATRQLAKRQLTWLRKYPGVHYLDGERADLSAACGDYLTRRFSHKGL
jgi:tRNA dimethylallyltransferase